MSGRKEQLTALLERVERATKRDREIDAAIALAFGWRHVMEPYSGGDPIPCWYDHNNTEQFLPYFTSSLDTAVALVERVLPRHTWHVSNYFGFSTGASAEIMQAVDAQSRPRAYAEAPTPALALCAALLKALIASERIGSPSQEQTSSEQNKNLPPEAVEP